jgi:hypothetical protein
LTRVTAWRTDEPCPCCGNDLTLLDHGDDPPVLTFECRICGWSSPWHGDNPNDPHVTEAE